MLLTFSNTFHHKELFIFSVSNRVYILSSFMVFISLFIVFLCLFVISIDSWLIINALKISSAFQNLRGVFDMVPFIKMFFKPSLSSVTKVSKWEYFCLCLLKSFLAQFRLELPCLVWTQRAKRRSSTSWNSTKISQRFPLWDSMWKLSTFITWPWQFGM